MVKITNGTIVLEVSNGAFKTIYAKQGFEKVEAEQVENEVVSDDTPVDDRTEEEKFCDDLLEKPISNWNKDEVKKFAEIKSVDISGTKNANEAKERIKAFLDAE